MRGGLSTLVMAVLVGSVLLAPAAHAANTGVALTWGLNDVGQLGDGTFANAVTPVAVSGLSGVTAIAAGGYHNLAVKTDGSVVAWGYNFYGQLGDGTVTNRLTPVAVSGLSGITAIAVGLFHSLALKSDGTVVTWGAHIGPDGALIGQSSPVAVRGLSGVTEISAGSLHGLALKTDGGVVAWGRNSDGQLGDGTTTDALMAVAVSGLTGVTAILPASSTTSRSSPTGAWSAGAAMERARSGMGRPRID